MVLLRLGLWLQRVARWTRELRRCRRDVGLDDRGAVYSRRGCVRMFSPLRALGVRRRVYHSCRRRMWTVVLMRWWRRMRMEGVDTG
jgi:hypothetical protein